MSNLGITGLVPYQSSGRQDDDFYPTPPNVTDALLNVETFYGPIWEPCCGDGAIAQVLEKRNYTVFGTDINPRDYGFSGSLFDFNYDNYNVITNPPFQLDNDKDAADVIRHFMKFNTPKVALLLKSAYWHAATRLPLFNEFKPSWIYPLTWRPDFLGLGRPVMEVSWVVWDKFNKDYPRYRPLEKPYNFKVKNRKISIDNENSV